MTFSSSLLRRLGGLTLLIVLVVGCGGKKFGSVSGTVKYKGKNLNGGTVAFIPSVPNAETATSPIDADGKYTIAKVLAGKCTITVSVPSETRVPGAGGRMMDAGKMGKEGGGGTSKVGSVGDQPKIKIPDKYGKQDLSGLSFEVKDGSNTHDITLQ